MKNSKVEVIPIVQEAFTKGGNAFVKAQIKDVLRGEEDRSVFILIDAKRTVNVPFDGGGAIGLTERMHSLDIPLAVVSSKNREMRGHERYPAVSWVSGTETRTYALFRKEDGSFGIVSSPPDGALLRKAEEAGILTQTVVKYTADLTDRKVTVRSPG
ncbi:Uncharacterised protein [uncultured archaeon]|nr:Uncharacterised protein [uncultured archaeon]